MPSQTYYAANEQEELTFWPEDFRMVAGNPFRTSFEADSIEHETFELLCLGGSGKSNAWPTSGVRSHPALLLYWGC